MLGDIRKRDAWPRRTAVPLLAAMALAAVGCAASKVIVQSAEGDPTCRSFEWLPENRPTPLVDRQIRNEVMTVLKQKGYEVTDVGTADCQVTYGLVSEVGRDSGASIGVGAGGVGGHVGGGVGVSVPIGRRSNSASDFTLRIIDVESNAEIWNGRLEGTMSAEPSVEETREAVRRIFEELPDRGA